MMPVLVRTQRRTPSKIINNIKEAYSDAIVVDISDIELKNSPRNIKVLQDEDNIAVVDP